MFLIPCPFCGERDMSEFACGGEAHITRPKNSQDMSDAEWAEFVSECDKFEIEIAKERRIGKLTVAELDEEEHSLDRLRRWWRDLKARDIFAVPEGIDAEDRIKRCTETLDAYADEVYAAAHAPLGRTFPDE